MFKSTPANPYDDIVVKATDETLTSENWEIILNLCDKVLDEGEQGARNVIAAILKRLAHRNPNVQLYSLTLAESLSKNCSKELHSEIASRAFTQALERLIIDRTTHDKVRNRTLMLIAMWTADFESDPTLGIMEECYENLKAKNYKFEHSDEPPPQDDNEARRREEEELQRVLELSIQDKGGRRNWTEYSLASSSGAGGSSSKATVQSSTQASTAHQPAVPSSSSASTAALQQPTHPSGYTTSAETHAPAAAPPTAVEPPRQPSPAGSKSPAPSTEEVYVSRVRALYSFEPTDDNELAFDKGAIIKVHKREYKDWWRGACNGRIGIFPVNYVEPLPEPTPAELATEAQQEAGVFSQAANVDRLLNMLRNLDPARDNLADNEEIQELYRSCMSLRPKIVKLIDKYSQKRAELVSMNESFVRARTIFDRMMEESLARHSEFYDQQRPAFPQPQSTYPRGESRLQEQQPLGYGRPADQPQGYPYQGVYDQGGYGAYPNPTAAYARQGGPIPDPRVGVTRSSSYAARQLQAHSQLQGQPPSQQVQQAPQPQPQTAYVQPYPAQDNPRTPYFPQSAPPQQQEAPLQQEQNQSPGQPQTQQQPQVQLQQQPVVQPHHQLQPSQSQVAIHAQPQTQSVAQQQRLAAQSQTPQQPEVHVQPQSQPQPEPQLQQQPQQPQPQAQAQQTLAGPPFVYNPNVTYPDPNVQAWAQYYAQGGTDPTGSVYFISVPGITDGRSPAGAAVQQPAEGQQQAQATAFSGSGSGSSPTATTITSSQGLHRQSSLPNPYGQNNSSPTGEIGGPASAGPGGHAGGRAPWEAPTGQFAQMRVGEPSVGA